MSPPQSPVGHRCRDREQVERLDWYPVHQDLSALTHRCSRPQMEAQLYPYRDLIVGRRVALAVGSRGVDGLADLCRRLGRWLADHGADPFLLPAMGSHGAGTVAGQREVLAGVGLTEASTGLPILPEPRVTALAARPRERLLVSRAALGADLVIPINRVKPHTDVSGDYESGLVKLLTIGLGQHEGATTLHQSPMSTFPELLPRLAREAIELLPVPFGVAVVEDARHRSVHVECIPGSEILDREPELLALARAMAPRIPVRHADVLLVGQLGKDVSGTGMDPHVTGRFYDGRVATGFGAERVAVAALTVATHGNATGMGMADAVSRRLVEQIDWTSTYVNEITAKMPQGARLPLVADSAEDALGICVETALGARSADQARLVALVSTRELEQLWVSPALVEELAAGPTGGLARCRVEEPVPTAYVLRRLLAGAAGD